jgi:hypothetical protein
MSSSNISAVPSPEKKRRYLSAEKKFQIYLEAQAGGKPVGELLRREGLFSTDLARSRHLVVKQIAFRRWKVQMHRPRGAGSFGGNCHHRSETHKRGQANPAANWLR